jgi:hypothetical protein
MKFTKEQLLDALKAKLTANGKHLSISEKTIKSLSDSHYDLLVSEETEISDLVNKILPQYVSLNGNYEKDNADFIKKWKEDHPEPNPNDTPNPNNDNSSEVEKKLLERLEALERKEAEAEAARLTSVKRGELLKKFKEKGISDDKWIEAYLKKLSISKDTDIEAETTDALGFYNLSHANNGGRNTPGNSGGNNNGDISADRWKGVNKALGGITPQK